MVAPANAPQWTLANTFAQNLNSVGSLAAKGTMVFAGNDTSLSSWDVTTEKQVAALDLQSQVRSIKIIGDSLLALVAATGQVTKFSLSPLAQTGACGASIIDYAVEGTSIYTLSSESNIIVYDLNGMNETGVLNTGIKGIMAIAYAAGILAINAYNYKKNYSSLSFCSVETGKVLKTVKSDTLITNLSTTPLGDFLTFNNSPVNLDGSFQLWNSEDFALQTSIVVSSGQPINTILVAPEGIFVGNGQIDLLRNDLTLTKMEELNYQNPLSMALVDSTSLVTSSSNSSGIALWKKGASELAAAAAFQWTKAQEITVGTTVTASAKMDSGIYTATGNQVSRWALNGTQLTLTSSNDLGVSIQKLVSCAGRLFCIANGASYNGPFQLISIDPITLKPGDVFTSDSLISDAAASDSTLYICCGNGVIYYLDPATLQSINKVGTNQKEIITIAVTPQALVASSNQKLISFNLETGVEIASGPTGIPYPLLLPIGQSTIVTAEQVPDTSNPLGLKVFSLKSHSPLAPQTQKIFQNSVSSAILFREGIVMAGNYLSCFSNDIDFKRLGDIQGSEFTYKLLKLSEDLFLASTATEIQVWQRESNPSSATKKAETSFFGFLSSFWPF